MTDAATLTVLRRDVETMPPRRAVELLLDLIEASIPEYVPAAEIKMRMSGFTPMETRILLILRASKARVITLDYLATRSGAAKPTTSPSVSVVLCKCRKKLADLGWPVSIQNVWGVGYRMVVEPGWIWPDQAEGAA